jgi:hypothetical protein
VLARVPHPERLGVGVVPRDGVVAFQLHGVYVGPNHLPCALDVAAGKERRNFLAILRRQHHGKAKVDDVFIVQIAMDDAGGPQLDNRPVQLGVQMSFAGGLIRRIASKYPTFLLR